MRLTKQQIIHFLKNNRHHILSEFKADVRGIFGSYTRDEANEQSDIDVLVHFEKGADLIHYMGLSLYLEEKLQIPVDIVPDDTLRKGLEEKILKETIYL